MHAFRTAELTVLLPQWPPTASVPESALDLMGAMRKPISLPKTLALVANIRARAAHVLDAVRFEIELSTPVPAFAAEVSDDTAECATH
jgi:hypothetical protein